MSAANTVQHECNAYCDPASNLHAIVVWVDNRPYVSEALVVGHWNTQGLCYAGVRVRAVRAWRTTEAPPLDLTRHIYNGGTADIRTAGVGDVAAWVVQFTTRGATP